MKKFAVVPDTNIFLASEKSVHSTSPNKEFVARWKREEFEVLYSEDTLLEYITKLRQKGISETSIKKLLATLFALGREIKIEFYHLLHYPLDPDDIAFLLCAENGKATHIITYDRHLKAIESSYTFRVCKPVEFLLELRHQYGIQPKA